MIIEVSSYDLLLLVISDHLDGLFFFFFRVFGLLFERRVSVTQSNEIKRNFRL